MVQPSSRGGKPRSKAVLHPVPWPKQNDTGGLQEEHAEIAIAAFGDAPEDRSITCRYLLGDQTESSSKIARRHLPHVVAEGEQLTGHISAFPCLPRSQSGMAAHSQVEPQFWHAPPSRAARSFLVHRGQLG